MSPVSPGTVAALAELERLARFPTLHAFYAAVQRAGRGGEIDQRLRNASTYQSEGTQADGGYSVPPDFRPGVQRLIQQPNNLFALLDQAQARSSVLTVPTDETTPWAATGIISPATGEGAAGTESKPILKQVVATLTKYMALVYCSDELVEDGAQIGEFVAAKATDKIIWRLNAALYTEATTTAAKITTAKGATAAGQPASLANLEAMLQNVVANGFERRAIWIANPTYMTTLLGAAYVLGSSWPAFTPAGLMWENSPALLLGRPIFFHEACATAGTEGDIVCLVPSEFYGISHAGAPVAAESLHADYAQDLAAFRVTYRAAVKCKWSAPITRPDSTTASCSVTLQTR